MYSRGHKKCRPKGHSNLKKGQQSNKKVEINDMILARNFDSDFSNHLSEVMSVSN